MTETVLISLCLLGVPCRYHGMTHRMGHRIGRKALVDRLHRKCSVLPLCGEQLGGLTTPRPPCKVDGDRVVTKDERDSPMCDRDNGVLGQLLTTNGIRVIRV